MKIDKVTLLFPDSELSDIKNLRDMWCETEARSLHLIYEGPVVELMSIQFSAKLRQYCSDYPNLNQRLAMLDGQAVGYLLWTVNANELVIVDIAVLPSYQGKGIASQLLGLCFEQASQKNKTCSLRVAHNNSAISLYKKLLFTIVESNSTHHTMHRSMCEQTINV